MTTDQSDSGRENDGVRDTRLLTGGGVVLGGIVLELLVSLGGKVLIARHLGKVDYGGVALGVTIAAVASTLSLAGLHTGVGRYLPRFDGRVDRSVAVWTAVAVVLGTSLAIAGGLVALAPRAAAVFGDPGLAPTLVVFALAVPAAALMRLSVGVAQGQQRSIPKVVVRNLTFPVVRLVGVVVVVLAGADAMGVASAYLLAYLVSMGVGGWYVLRWVSVRLPTADHASRLLSFSLPLFLTSALTLVLSDLDTLLLGALSTQGSVGVYNVVYPVAVLLLVFLRAVRFLFMPRISELDSQQRSEAIGANYHLMTKWLYFATTPALVFLLFTAELVVGALFGAEYTGGGLALRVLALGFYLHAVVGLNGTTLTSLGHTRSILAANVVAGALNVALNLILIPTYSLLGAAVATTLSYVTVNVLYSARLYSVTGVRPDRPWMLPMTLLSAGGVALLYADPLAVGPVAALSRYALFLIGFVVAFLRTAGVSEEELALVTDVSERIGVDSVLDRIGR